MKKILLAFAAVCSLSMAACATDGVGPGVTTASLPQRAETEAEVAYNVAAKLYLAAPPVDQALYKPKMTALYDLLLKVRKGEASTTALINAATALTALLPAQP